MKLGGVLGLAKRSRIWWRTQGQFWIRLLWLRLLWLKLLWTRQFRTRQFWTQQFWTRLLSTRLLWLKLLWTRLRQPQDRILMRIGLGLALALLCLVGFSSYNSVYQLIQSYHEVQHTYQVLHGIDQVNIGIKDVVLGRRGYVISESEVFLQMFRSGLQSTDVALSQLQQITADNPEQER
ncbi:MAG: CHASE3 domain-containing protein [Elainella sp.]